MLYLVTGTPGSGKTLNTIKFIRESKQFKDRDIYYYGIRDLNPEFGWIELTEEQAYKWYELPSNAVIVFDEAYTVFPTKHGAQGTPTHVAKVATHRHNGHDLFLICQKVVGQLDSFMRGLVNRHQHYARIMGSLNINRFTWDVCQQNPDSAGARKDANLDQFRMDKAYFGVYHSADTHTHTLSVPWKKIGFMFALVVALVLLVGKIIDRYTADPSPDQPGQTEIAGQGSLSGMVPSYNTAASEQLSFAELVTPEIEHIPWSAPIYREKYTEVNDWPRPAACYQAKSSGCKCFTQQASPLDVPEEMCQAIVSGGWFDHTRPVDSPFDPSLGGGVGGSGSPTPPNTNTQQEKPVEYIGFNNGNRIMSP